MGGQEGLGGSETHARHLVPLQDKTDVLEGYPQQEMF